MRLPWNLRAFVQNLSDFPWGSTVSNLRVRFREDRLGQTAGSLTFTTTIALVPLITVGLAVFSAFPMFGKLLLLVQRWLIESLVPESISRQVLGYLTQFAGQANRLGSIGLVVLFGTALALILTIDRTLNAIWRVRQTRRLAQRMLIYWSGMTLAPLLLGASVTMTSYAVSASKGLVGGMPGSIGFLLDSVQFVILSAGTAALYYYVPNTTGKWSHAWAGGLFVSAAMEIAKKLLVLYLAQVPTYSVIYGTFATVPILLVWIYLAWVIVLLGAVITAYLPSLRSGVVRHDLGAGGRFQLALESLQFLHRARATVAKGLTVSQLTRMLQVSHLSTESALEALVELDWVARLDDSADQVEARYVLLANTETTRVEPLMQSLLLHRTASTESVWRSARWADMRLRELL